jgi:hypothetical protein
MRKLMAAILCLAAPLAASAGSSSSGKLHSLIFDKSGAVIFWSTGARSARPDCAADDRWVLDASTAGGKALLDGLLAAYSAGRSVVIVGTGGCGFGWSGEAIQYFYMVD